MDHHPDPLLIKSNSRLFGNPGGIQHIDKLLREFFSQHIIQAADTVAAGSEDNAFIVFFHDLFQNSLGKAADIRVHSDLRLVKICHIGLNPLHFHSHSLKNLHRSILTNIS